MNWKKVASEIKERNKELEGKLSSPGVTSIPARYAEIAKAHSKLSSQIRLIERHEKIEKEIEDVSSLVNEDKEITALAQEEIRRLQQEMREIESKFVQSLKPADSQNAGDLIIEVRAGTGGEEAALFVKDILRMYLRFAERRGLKTELFSSHPTAMGGFKEVIFSVTGRDAYRLFKFEGGTHRVQRVPATETQGRIHTSAVTVAVLPVAKEVEVKIVPQELRIETYRSTGKGGQHLNVTDSAVRITYLPTGIVATCQNERSQIRNRQTAMKILRARILAAREKEQGEKEKRARKKQVGTGDRSEKIRTYNFPQNRVTDHRIGFTLRRLENVLSGEVDEIIEKLLEMEIRG